MPPPTSVIGHHLIWTLYGHWLANDPRGSGSEILQQGKFAVLGLCIEGESPSISSLRALSCESFIKQQSLC